MEELINKIKLLEEENLKLKTELIETNEHLKKYTAPKRHKVYYEKQKAAKEIGYNYEIWVYDSKGNKKETYL